jgi:hypothetical protein
MEDSGQAASYDSSMQLTLRDCSVYGGRINVGEAYDGSTPFGSGSVSWMNNLFDGVSINLDPAWAAFYYTNLNCDLRVEARNNLFRGGLWFHLEPIPASAGNWVLTDNLFDKVNFIQDPASPLDFAYNAYWPLSSAELQQNQSGYRWFLQNSGRLLPAPASNGFDQGAGDLCLTSAPPYQVGPLGRYYLPNSTPLFGAGSRPASDAGLFHYTTRLDQTKEGSGQMVNIGLHYVATAGPASSQPLDSDGDGIPDYVENWHGDGNYNLHADSETDWTNAWTVVGTYDPTNSVYDDVDLSGNGLVGRIKKALGSAPFETNNPLTLKQVVTGDEPDIVTFEVPVNPSWLATNGALTLFVDGENAAFAACVAAPEGTNCLLKWNTTYEPPGQHYPAAYLSLSDHTSGQGVGRAFGKLAPFYSPNVLQFDEASGQYDENGAVLYAFLPQAHASYTIELRDPANPSSPHIRTFTGSTSSGEIEMPWDVTYDGGVTVFTGDQVEAVFTVNLLDNPASGTSKQMLNRGTVRVPDGTFDVAFMWDYDDVAQPYYGAMWYTIQNAVVNTLMQQSIPWLWYESSFNGFTWDLDPGYPGYLPDWNAATNLLGDLERSWTRNFYFKGHGAVDALSDGKTCPSPPGARLWISDVANSLGNSYDPWQGVGTKHPYRFVFLDCCSAGTLDWQHAFGITQMRLQSPKDAWLARSGPQAFIGWKSPRKPGCGGDSSCWEHYGDTLEVFFVSWMMGYTLNDCVKFASDRNTTAPIIGRQLTKPFPVWKNRDLWNDSWSPLYIGGYRGITRGSYVPGY